MTERTLDADVLCRWIGRKESVDDVIRPGHAALLSATLDRDQDWAKPGADLPPLWHWTYFLGAAPRRDLGRDGHPKLGGFLPPVALPRRMWAGGRLKFCRPLRLGEEARRTSTIRNVEIKHGRSGALCFVTIEHAICVGGELRIEEEQDVVYREDPSPGSASRATAAPPDAQVSETLQPDSTLLFRYSALTFNGHRIHYDRDYAKEVEGYGGLVVHGPLIATLLLDLAVRQSPGASVAGFSYRGVAPIFDTQAFSLNLKPEGEGLHVWAAAGGQLSMDATVTLGQSVAV
ncbi:MAG: MaoC family dehydratase N-terminal domain-containing protein [Burkholderiales bacterium]